MFCGTCQNSLYFSGCLGRDVDELENFMLNWGPASGSAQLVLGRANPRALGCSLVNPRTDWSATDSPRRSTRRPASSARSWETDRRRSAEPRRQPSDPERRSKFRTLPRFCCQKSTSEKVYGFSFISDRSDFKSLPPWVSISVTTRVPTKSGHTAPPQFRRMSTWPSSSRPTASWPDELTPPSTRTGFQSSAF